jgi:hypothetical protein
MAAASIGGFAQLAKASRARLLQLLLQIGPSRASWLAPRSAFDGATAQVNREWRPLDWSVAPCLTGDPLIANHHVPEPVDRNSERAPTHTLRSKRLELKVLMVQNEEPQSSNLANCDNAETDFCRRAIFRIDHVTLAARNHQHAVAVRMLKHSVMRANDAGLEVSHPGCPSPAQEAHGQSFAELTATTRRKLLRTWSCPRQSCESLEVCQGASTYVASGVRR